jgi:hypothetical protein
MPALMLALLHTGVAVSARGGDKAGLLDGIVDAFQASWGGRLLSSVGSPPPPPPPPSPPSPKPRTRTARGCVCMPATVDGGGSTFSGCGWPLHGWCDVRPGCVAAQDQSKADGYHGWDLCLPEPPPPQAGVEGEGPSAPYIALIVGGLGPSGEEAGAGGAGILGGAAEQPAEAGRTGAGSGVDPEAQQAILERGEVPAPEVFTQGRLVFSSGGGQVKGSGQLVEPTGRQRAQPPGQAGDAPAMKRTQAGEGGSLRAPDAAEGSVRVLPEVLAAATRALVAKLGPLTAAEAVSDCTAGAGAEGGRSPPSGAAAVASFLAAVLTEIYLCNACS